MLVVHVPDIANYDRKLKLVLNFTQNAGDIIESASVIAELGTVSIVIAYVAKVVTLTVIELLHHSVRRRSAHDRITVIKKRTTLKLQKQSTAA